MKIKAEWFVNLLDHTSMPSLGSNATPKKRFTAIKRKNIEENKKNNFQNVPFSGCLWFFLTKESPTLSILMKLNSQMM